ncbi:MAG TPA: MBL fold metallo-hydrolase [Chryseolinea sp.]|nr:MBL fold metallo-hydrolase [Chryseolinea sp.]
MNRKKFLAFFSGLAIFSSKAFAKKKTIQIDFIRHATFTLRVGGVNFLIDPMLSNKHEMDPVGNAQSNERIPMVALPFSESTLAEKLQTIDAVIVTHTHRDHWDVKAQSILNKKLTLLCQPADRDKLKQQGFANSMVVNDEIDFKGVKIYRVNGQHGTGDIGTRMGPVSGFVLTDGEKKIYIAGDTIWCDDVDQTIKTHKPDVVVVNAGAAQFNQGDPITMTSKDVIRTITASKSAKVVAVHMETVNHCLLKKSDLRKELETASLLKNCVIPMDGEKIHFN